MQPLEDNNVKEYSTYMNLDFNFSSLFLPYRGEVVTSQLYLVEETGVPGENHRLTPSHRQSPIWRLLPWLASQHVSSHETHIDGATCAWPHHTTLLPNMKEMYQRIFMPFRSSDILWNVSEKSPQSFSVWLIGTVIHPCWEWGNYEIHLCTHMPLYDNLDLHSPMREVVTFL